MPYFTFNNISSKDYEIYISELPPVHSVSNKIEYLEVSGRDGYLTIDTNKRSPINKRIVFEVLNDKNLHYIMKWLRGSGRVSFSNYADFFYYARVQSPREYVGARGGKKVEINFMCQPWAYLYSGNNKIEITSKNTKLINNEEDSNPLIKIFGNGAVDLIINNDIHKFNINQYVEIDSELMESYKDSQEVTFKGKFPKLKTGENNITWTGNVSRIEVIPRWRL